MRLEFAGVHRRELWQSEGGSFAMPSGGFAILGGNFAIGGRLQIGYSRPRYADSLSRKRSDVTVGQKLRVRALHESTSRERDVGHPVNGKKPQPEET
jgi:hypothetical protein